MPNAEDMKLTPYIYDIQNQYDMMNIERVNFRFFRRVFIRVSKRYFQTFENHEITRRLILTIPWIQHYVHTVITNTKVVFSYQLLFAESSVRSLLYKTMAHILSAVAGKSIITLSNRHLHEGFVWANVV